MRTMSRFARQQHLTPSEVTEDVVVLARRKIEGAASREHAEALKNYASEEAQRIDILLKERTLETRIRQEAATAAKLESEARLARIKESDALVELLRKVHELGVTLRIDGENNIDVSKAPVGFDWQRFIKQVIAENGALSKTNLLPPSQE